MEYITVLLYIMCMHTNKYMWHDYTQWLMNTQQPEQETEYIARILEASYGFFQPLPLFSKHSHYPDS